MIGAPTVLPNLETVLVWRRPAAHNQQTERNQTIWAEHYQAKLPLRELIARHKLTEQRICQILQAERKRRR